jgi:hypothetical protein
LALKSVLDIEVNDAAFKRYQSAFKSYQDMLSKTPAAWDKVTKGIDASRKSFDALVAAQIARLGYEKTIAEAEDVAQKAVDRQSRSWRDMARSTKDVAGNIVSATRQLLRWAELTSVFTGLLGAGGLFGLSRLAQNAAGAQRSASGLGVSVGDQRAFELNYRYLLDPDRVLGAVSTGLGNAGSPEYGALLQAGLSPQQLQGKNAAEVAVMLEERLKLRAQQTDPRFLGNLVQNEGFGTLGLDLDAARRARSGDVAGAGRGFEANRKSLDFDATAWQRFTNQLTLAGETIEKVLVEQLKPLEKPLENLSKAFVKLVETVLGSKTGENVVGGLASGINSLAESINDGTFQKAVHTFVDDIVLLAESVHKAIQFLFGDKSSEELDPRFRSFNRSKQDDTDLGDYLGQTPLGRFFKWLKDNAQGSLLGPNPTSYRGGGYSGLVVPTSYSPPDNADTGSNARIAHDFFRGHDWTEAQTAGLLANAQAESGFDPHRVNKVGGDAGLFQWRGARARQFAAFFGHTPDQGTLGEQLWFAQWELTEGGERAAGNRLRATTTDYAAGVSVARDYERPDPNRIDTIAAERGGLARQFNGRFGGVRVEIYNNTGGSAIASAAALPG